MPPDVTNGRGPTRIAWPWSLLASHRDRLLFAVSVLTILCWALLVHWYGLVEYAARPYFAFDKVPGHFASPILQGTTLVLLALAALYGAGYWVLAGVPQLSTTIKIAVVLLVTGALIANILLYPVGALDVFNYLAELKLAFFYHRNPYFFTFRSFTEDPFARYAFLLDLPLFYGPAWLLLSGLPALLVGFADPIRLLVALKGFNAILLLVIALAIAQARTGERRRWLAIYTFLANPLILFEGVGNAHNDVLMALFLVLAVLALRWRPRYAWLAIPFLTVSILVKFFTAALFPLLALAIRHERWRGWQLLAAVLISLAIAIGTVAPFWAQGELLSGLSRGLTLSQEVDSTSLYSLAREYLRLHHADPAVVDDVRLVCAGLFVVSALLALWAFQRQGRAVELAMTDTFLWFALLLSLLYPWYLIPAVTLLVLRRDRAGQVVLFALTGLGLIYHPLSVLAWFDLGWSPFSVHLFQALFLTVPIGLYLVYQSSRVLWKIKREPSTIIRRRGRILANRS